VLTARQLLEAMLLPSGCDAAYLLATAYGPGRAAFIGKMNATALALGLTSTHFTSFDGMPYPTEHSTYSTPADLIKLAEAAMRHRNFREIVAQHKYYLPPTHAHHSYLWYTTDGLIGSYRGALGIKTGDTKAAGNCLLFAAKRDGRTLIGVVLHAAPGWNPGSAIDSARSILTWGFAQVAAGRGQPGGASRAGLAGQAERGDQGVESAGLARGSDVGDRAGPQEAQLVMTGVPRLNRLRLRHEERVEPAGPGGDGEHLEVPGEDALERLNVPEVRAAPAPPAGLTQNPADAEPADGGARDGLRFAQLTWVAGRDVQLG
jgi:D-alanyl-D-alanine carboxypeptidase